MSEFVGVVTTIGQQKIAAAIGGAALNLTTIRVGDGNGAPIVPAPGMTDLVRRVGAAYPIISSGRDPVNLTHWRVTALIPAADGPFDIREIGVFDAAGDMIAIAKHVLVEKRSPAQGAAVELTTDIVFPVSETAQVTVQIQPSAAVSILQMLRAGFCSVESAQVANPPANPALGVTYVVAAAATGAWAGLTNRLVQWNGTVWVSIDPPQGFLVIAQDRALDHSDRWLRRIAGGWASARAAEDVLGVVELATAAEVQAGVDAVRVITPAGLSARVASETASGLVRLATEAEAAAGTSETIGVSPRRLRWAINMLQGRHVYRAVGTYSFTVPDGVYQVLARVWGGGGAGGATGDGSAGGLAGNAGGGGGAGGFAEKLCAVIPGQTISVTVGAGGAASNSAGGSGGTSSFGSFCSATGGAGGGWGGYSLLAAGNGGAGVGGDFNLSGGSGGSTDDNLATYNNNMPLHQPAKGGLPPMGVGTVDWFGTGAAGRGIATGGTGGSGGVNGPGGAGAPGAVILEW